MSNLKEQFKDDNTSYFHYYHFLKLLPRPESLVLAYLIAQDAYETDRVESYFRCPIRNVMQEFECVFNTADKWLLNLESWGYIKRERLKPNEKNTCTYISLQNENILLLRDVYLVSKIDTTFIKQLSKIDTNYYQKLKVVLSKIDTNYYQLLEHYKNNKNNKNNKSENPTPMSVLGEKEKDKDKPRDAQSTTEWGVWEDGMFHYHSIVVPKHFNDYLLQKKEWSEKILKQKLKYLEGYLVQFPKQRYWVSTTPESYANLLDSAYAFMTAPASEKETRLG